MEDSLSSYIGKKFNKWTILEIVEEKTKKGVIFSCKCECGLVKNVSKANLIRNQSKSCRSCGVKKDKRKEDHRLYSVWKTMRSRCSNPNVSNYSSYGGRGIKVCDRWQDFDLFTEDMYPSFEEGLTLDRIDVNGNYYPENCRWATMEEQCNNKNNNLNLLFEGEYYTEAQLARKTGVNKTTLQRRRNAGYSVDEMDYGKNLKGKFEPFKIEYKGKEYTLKELSILLNIPLPTLQSRKKKGISYIIPYEISDYEA